MKKVFYIALIFVCFIFFNDNISAEVEKIASCVYKAQNVINDEAPAKLVININKDYTINFDYLGYTKNRKECADPTSKSYKNNGCDQMTFDVSYDFTYGDFISEKKFDCNNISKIYHNNKLDIAHMTISYTFNKNQSSSLKGVYVLDKEASAVEISNPTEVEKEEGWLKVCHYNDVTLKFNKSKYEILNAYPIKKGYPLESTNLLDYIANNNYSCPFKYCYYTANGQEDIDGNIVYTNLGYFINAESDYIKHKTCYFSADYSGDEFICGAILLYMNDFDLYNEKYSSTGEVNYLNLRNESEEKIKNFCQSILVNSNYEDSNNCVKECISIGEVISNRIGEQSENIACGFSKKLFTWILNIFKWVKYILPVIVIVFGILDFIKAIGADKEDEMKKAQKRFVTRLIAAALVFIVPLILEFILIKMGFTYEGCGIFN